ncbi:hypothetical protein B566_EDAN016731 [Ephemera danica]|nr:hypothetical protein B566_EDAN016731 [Ephemera danica]
MPCHICITYNNDMAGFVGVHIDAATEAVVILEDSPLSNAALGSSLTWDGNVECDAGVMEGTNKHWGAVGAVSGVKNPCRLAREICVQQSRVDGLGRIQPWYRQKLHLLVGPGAVSWAIKNSVPTLDPESLVHALAKNKFETYKRRILTLQEYNSKKAMEQLDTVGAVCIDGLGRTAAVCSSGGIALKESGRVGQAAMFGAGCWAENCTEDKLAVAACTTGCGEHLMRCSLAQRIATAIREQPPGNISASVFNTVIQSHFLGKHIK